MNRVFSCRGARYSLVLFFALVGLFPFAGVANAGQQNAASIFGQIKDESGGTLPGVTVTIKSPALQAAEMTAVTDERGEYRVSPLPAGTYLVEYTLSGFQTIRREGVALTLGFQARLDEVLKVGSLEETVTVSGASPVVDVQSSASTTKLDQAALEILPTGRSGINDLLSQAPGTRGQYGTGGSNMDTNPSFRAFGQINEYWSTLEGVVTTPPIGNQGNFYDYSSMDESVIQTVGNDAEMPRRGVYLASLMKSGGNQFHGEAYISQTGNSFQWSNIDDDLASKGFTANRLDTRWDRSFQAGGKIIVNKLWYFASIRDRDEVTEIPNAFAKVQPPFPPPPGAQPRLSGPLYVSDGSAKQDLSQPQGVVKISYQMTSSNKITGFLQLLEKHRINAPSLFQSPLSPADEHTYTYVAKAGWQHVHGNAFVFEFNQGYWGLNVVYPGRTTEPTSSDLTTQASWGDASSHGNLPYNYRATSNGTISWYRPDVFFGNHDMKAGVIYTSSGIGRIWDSRSANNGATENLTSGNYTLIFRGGVPFEFGAFNSPVRPHNLDHYLGTFIRDSWTIHRRLTLNLGLRWSRDNAFAPPQCQGTTDFPTVYPTQCFDQVQLKVFNSFAPRVNASYDLTGDGKTVVKGGWDRFDHMCDITPEVDLLNRNVFTTTTFLWHDNNKNFAYDPGEVNLNPNGPDFVSLAGTTAELPNLNQLQPKEDEYSISIEREVMNNMGLRFTGLYAHDFNTYLTSGVQRPASAYNIPITSAILGPDGKTPTGQSLTWYDYPASLAGLANSQTMTVNGGPETDQTYKSFEIALAKRMANNWQLNASYSTTWSYIPNGAGVVSTSATPGLAGQLNPNSVINTANDTREWLGRISGAYLFPKGFTASANFEHQSGLPTAPQQQFTGGKQIPNIVLNIAPVGSLYLPDLDTLDLRLAKAFTLGGSKRLEVRVNMFNALNINKALTENVRVGSTYLYPTTIVLPRVLDFSLGFRF